MKQIQSSIKNILVGIIAGEKVGSGKVLDYAMGLAQVCNAHLSARIMAVKHVAPGGFMPSLAGGLLEAVNAEEKQYLDKRSAEVRKTLAASGLAFDDRALLWEFQDQAEGFTRSARLHDIAILDAEAEPLALGRAIAEETLFNSGRPVIIVPPHVSAFKAGRIIVAWDGSSRAARALNDAMPLLRDAARVEIVCLTGEKDLPEGVLGADIAPQLARHGISPVVSVIPAIGGNVATALYAHAAASDADMVVMGAFHHSRWRQLILGGVTQTMLDEPKIPLFLSF